MKHKSLLIKRQLLRLLALIAIPFILLASFGTAFSQERQRRTTSESTAGRQAGAIQVSHVTPTDLATIRNYVQAYGTLSDEEFSNWIASVQYPNMPSSDQQRQWTAQFVRNVSRDVVEDGDTIYRLSERSAPVLRLFHREGKLRFIVFNEPSPFVNSVSGTCIGFSTGALALVKTDDELYALVAHELAHEYTDVEYHKAFATQNWQRTRALELNCDAIAARVLLALGRDPHAMATIIFKALTYSAEMARLNDGTTDHPNLATRLRLNEELCRAFARTRRDVTNYAALAASNN